MEAIIRLENLFFRYGDVEAIRDVSLTLPAGIFGLLGPNGAGKTTLMKLLLGFLQPASGRGEIMGQELGAKKKSLRRSIGYMPESDCLIPGLDAVSLTAYLGELSGMPRQEAMKRAHDVLYYVGLEESRYRQVETYSTGMKQRLKLAQALVHDPNLLLLDEPTSGMDPAGRKEMLELIRDIAKKESMNIILSSHLLPDIESTCRQVVIMNRGRIAAEESIAGLKKDRRNVFEIRVVGDGGGFFAALAAAGWQAEEKDQGLFQVKPPEGTEPAALFRAAREHSAQIRHFRQSRTSLEDAFMDVIRGSDGN
ncbi:MAG: ABC transporter ATP-binding protein [Acidobacteria bacterium]|jgi:ABC-2 type transport system ATP-binding protein|nr:ABC transporter ATP-binding protein [Acidobacteriota bacterium]